MEKILNRGGYMKNVFGNNKGSLLVSGGTIIILLAITLVMSATTSGYSDIYEEASYTADISNARLLVSATLAHNAVAEANEENDRIITYDMLMAFATTEEFNDSSDIDINSLSDDEFNVAKEYIYEDFNGDLLIIED